MSPHRYGFGDEPPILALLKNVRGRNGQWRADCPSCGKSRRLSVSEGADRVLVNCFGGCRPRAVVEAVGLDFDDLLYEREAKVRNLVDLARGRSTPVPVEPCSSSPTPPNEGEQQRRAEITVLLADYEAGRARRVPVDAPTVPDDAPELARRIYEDMLLRWSLRLGADMPENRPLPYAVSLPLSAGWCRHEMQASRAIHWLEDKGLIWSPGKTPPRSSGPSGTRLFLPGPKPLAASPDDWRVRPRVLRLVSDEGRAA